MSPSPLRYHQVISRNLVLMIGSYLEKSSIGEIYFAPFDVCLSEVNVYQPDLVFISNQNRSILTEQGAEGAPDLVVEILSPSTARYDKGSKRKIYARTGVKELWVVDPDAKNIQAYNLARDAETPQATYDSKSVFKSPLLPGLRIRGAQIFKK